MLVCGRALKQVDAIVDLDRRRAPRHDPPGRSDDQQRSCGDTGQLPLRGVAPQRQAAAEHDERQDEHDRPAERPHVEHPPVVGLDGDAQPAKAGVGLIDPVVQPDDRHQPEQRRDGEGQPAGQQHTDHRPAHPGEHKANDGEHVGRPGRRHQRVGELGCDQPEHDRSEKYRDAIS